MYISMVSVQVTDTYDQHQAIWSLFPSTPDRKRDHLFRVESTATDNTVLILLQSSTEPRSSDRAKVLQSKPFSPQITREAFYKFKVLAYPTKCLSQGKKVIEIHDENQQVEWLQRKLSGANVTVTAMEPVLVKSRKSHTNRFVCFEGIIQVINEEQVQQALITGIGRQKHAGAGLLSLARTSC